MALHPFARRVSRLPWRRLPAQREARALDGAQPGRPCPDGLSPEDGPACRPQSAEGRGLSLRDARASRRPGHADDRHADELSLKKRAPTHVDHAPDAPSLRRCVEAQPTRGAGNPGPEREGLRRPPPRRGRGPLRTARSPGRLPGRHPPGRGRAASSGSPRCGPGWAAAGPGARRALWAL